MKIDNNKGFSLKNLILTIIFIAIIIFLIFWIVNMRKEIKANQLILESAVNSSESTEVIESNTFDSNLDLLKEGAVKYFLAKGLPSDIGDSKKVSLTELMDQGFVSSIKNKKDYNLDDSYAKMTKTSNEYVMKVYLKGNNKTDYKIYYYGNYDYCEENTICEKQNPDDVSKKDAIIVKNIIFLNGICLDSFSVTNNLSSDFS